MNSSQLIDPNSCVVDCSFNPYVITIVNSLPNVPKNSYYESNYQGTCNNPNWKTVSEMLTYIPLNECIIKHSTSAYTYTCNSTYISIGQYGSSSCESTPFKTTYIKVGFRYCDQYGQNKLYSCQL